jgi:hypothetical protein
MTDVALDKPFFSLPSIGLGSNIAELVLDTMFYENAMAMQNGNINLQSITKDSLSDGVISRLSQIVP